MHHAIDVGHESVKTLIALRGTGADIDQPDAHGMTPLMFAARNGQLDATKWILAQSPRSHKMRDSWGRTAVHCAAESSAISSPEILEQLLEAGADLNVGDGSGYTPVEYLAHSSGDYRTLSRKLTLMKAAGANMDAIDRQGENALSVCLRKATPWNIRLLLQAGADITKLYPRGQNILHRAAKMATEEAMTEISEFVATSCLDPFLFDTRGQTPWDVFILSIRSPRRLGDPVQNAPRCLAFEALFVTVRRYHVQEQLNTLSRTISLLQSNAFDEAESLMAQIADQEEPRNIWETGVSMKTLRSLLLLIRLRELDEAMEALQDLAAEWEAMLEVSPWSYESRSWDGQLSFEGATDEDYEETAAFADRMRSEGLLRWQEMMCDSEMERGSTSVRSREAET